MDKALSTELITHKLKIKWEWTRLISRKLAENIFNQIIDKTRSTIEICNPHNLTYIQKYKSEVSLIPLEDEELTIEELIIVSWLSKSKQEEVRYICETRKKEKRKVNEQILKNIINSVKN